MTFGINGAELIILILLAVLVLGPEKLPEYARKLTELIRNLRNMAEGAKTQFREETGTDFDEIDWKKYDPRQYDPRRIIRDALSEPVDGGTEGAAAASISESSGTPDSSTPAASSRSGLRGDLDSARSTRDELRDDLKDMDPRALLFGASSRRPASRAGAATATSTATAATATAAVPDDAGAESTVAISEESTGDEPTTGEPAEPAPFDADAT